MANVLSKAMQSVAVDVNAKISSIQGESCEYYVSDIKPESAPHMHPYLDKWDFNLASTTQGSDGVIATGTSQVMTGQFKHYSAREIANQDPNQPKAKGYVLVWAANQRQNPRLYKLVFGDEMTSQAYAESYIVNLVTITWIGADPDGGSRGTPDPSNTPIDYKGLEWVQETEHAGNNVDDGRLLLTISLEDVTLAQVNGADHFTVQRKGGSAGGRYALVKGSIKHLASHHVQLELVKRS